MTYLLLASILAAVIVVWMRRDKLDQIGEVKFKLWWVIPIIALGQGLTVRFLYAPHRFTLWHPRPLIMIGSYILLWAVVCLNCHLAGMWWVLTGVTLNLLVIAANGGYMPMPPQALARIGAGQAAFQWAAGTVIRGSKDVLLPSQQAIFWMLGDILIIPEPFPWPTAMSIGDVILAVGIFLFIQRTSKARRSI